MAKRALSWKRAAAIGWRDLKSAPGKFAFVVLSVAVGVAALVGVRGFQRELQANAHDRGAVADGRRPERAHFSRADAREEEKQVAGSGEADSGDVRATWVTETVSMASVPPDPVPLLVSLKAVDPAEYPYYGTAELEPDDVAAAGSGRRLGSRGG